MKTDTLVWLALGCLMGTTVQAAVQTYSTRSAWTSAVSGVTDIDFEGIAPQRRL